MTISTIVTNETVDYGEEEKLTAYNLAVAVPAERISQHVFVLIKYHLDPRRNSTVYCVSFVVKTLTLSLRLNQYTV